MKFRKKPVVIEAFHYRGQQDINLLRLFVGNDEPLYQIGDDCLGIHTLEGVMKASPGDWIVRGVKGELYPVKPYIFAATYEPVEQSGEGRAE